MPMIKWGGDNRVQEGVMPITVKPNNKDRSCR